MLPAIAEASAALGHVLGLDARAGADWQARVLGRLGAPPVPPSTGEEPASLRRALARLRQMAPLDRPRLARAWLEAGAARHGHPASALAAAEALQLACLLLDTPAPQPLPGGAPAARPGAAASQLRSL
jgi:hypothetical protein